MNRVYNFSPGPSALPLPVLEKAQKELLDYRGTGISVMEMSHRSPVFQEIVNNAKGLLIELMSIPENYEVLFLQGGASTQFSAVPLNLFTENRKADYAITGSFAKKAAKEAKRYGTIIEAASSADKNFSYIPDIDAMKPSPDSDFFHITTNNTIYGTRYTKLPDTGDVPLVADMSSNILAEVYDISKFGVIYAGAQKNMAPSGLTVVIVRKDLIGKAMDITPTMLDYKTQADQNSLYNTPTTFSIYMAGLVFEWLKDLGGVSAMEKINIEKSDMVYDCIDNSDFYEGTANPKDRSRMNVTFTLPSDELTARFVKEAGQAGLATLKGHRSVGGIRASIYNAMPVEGVKALVEFMKKFELENKSEA
ncbi:MAG: 3-phosphoserine/phosphohydroxythreonine transaminase [Clostridiales bacterium]|nr:3-phosphoserine/phosphohydroxythreonine transaminase [Clostridiales bacterium]